MMAMTALLCAFSTAPYIYLNLGPNNLKKSTTWVFPVLRATGGFITATLIQLLIQRRITTLSDQYLVKRDLLPNRDVEAAVKTKKYQTDAHIWLFLYLLLIGLIASVVGYVGCFSVVQNSTSKIGPVSWLCLEAGLSVIRLAIWALNPTRDDAPPLEIILKLDGYKHGPLPTCNKYNEEILRSKVLPLTRPRDFLKIITSFAGLIEPFNNTDLSLYYTLTRRRPPEKSVKLGERTLYITVFDHKERTTRVYTREKRKRHFLLEVEITAKIDPKVDPAFSDGNILDSLRNHHRSILENIQYRLGATDLTERYGIENSWTMKVEDTVSTLQRLREESGDDWKKAVVMGKKKERNEESLLICDYFMHSTIERERRLLDEERVKWIAHRMEMIAKETKERFQGEVEVEYRVNMQAVEKKPAIKSPREIEALLYSEQCLMELLLLSEMNEWERLFWNKLKALLDKIGNDRVEEKKRLKREWRADCWKRLNPQMHAADKRVANINKDVYSFSRQRVQRKWGLSISQLLELEGDENWEIQNSNLLSDLKREVGNLRTDETRLRMEKEIEDTEFRLKRGSDLRQFD